MGVYNVDRMLHDMDHKQFIGWQAFYALEPFTPTRADYNSAMIVKALWDINRDPKKHPQPFLVENFRIDWEERSQQEHQRRQQEQEELAQQQLVNKMLSFTGMFEVESQEHSRQGTRILGNG